MKEVTTTMVEADDRTPIDLGPYMEDAVTRRYEIKGILYNIHGEHDKRTQMISELIYSEKDQVTEEDSENEKKTKDKIEKRARRREKQKLFIPFLKMEMEIF